VFQFKQMNKKNARKILTWRYPPPYDIYNLGPEKSEESVAYLMKPENRFFSILSESGDLVGFCSFGPDGQVPGGDYRAEALDIGMGVRPDLTGQGEGIRYVRAILDFARETLAPACFRVTIAGFNRRAIQVWSQAGFRPVHTFEKTGAKEDAFVVMIREE